MKTSIENVGSSYDLELSRKAQKLTKKVVSSVASKVFVGMTEEDGFGLIENALKKFQSEGTWHPHKFRIGENTLKSFREKSSDQTLEENDLFSIDIGPIFQGHEGDYGDTFFFGDKNAMSERMDLPQKAHTIFERLENEWQQKQLTGVELYQKAQEIAASLGVCLNQKMAGHRLGDFPHSLHHKGQLGNADITPVSERWVLEILIEDQKLQRGAFFEDILSS